MKLKKFFLSLFRVDNTQKSYKLPAIKMICSASLVLIMFCITLNIDIENKTLGNIVSSFSTILLILCAYCFVIAWSELGYAQDNKEKANADYQKYLKMAINISLEKTLSMIFDNDIIDFNILFDEKIVYIGASSDSNNSSSKFFDKRYYINDHEFENFEEFKLKIMEYSINDMILVARIDELPAKKYFK